MRNDDLTKKLAIFRTEWYFKSLARHIWKRVVFQGLEMSLSSKYGKCAAKCKDKMTDNSIV